MKKLLSYILCISISAGMLAATTVFGEKDITVELDGQAIDFDVRPENIEGRTMVPLRKIFEEIGASVKWNNDTKTVSARKNSKTITLSVGSTDLQIDKGKTDDEGNPIIETVTLEVPAQIVSDRTLVPTRAISESFGLNVDWDDDKRKVVITSDEEEDDTWKENVGTINLDKLTSEGEGVEFDGKQIKITKGGDFTLTGELKDGNITVSTKEKVKLRLDGAKITSSANPCIFVEDADKAYITISKGTKNYLVAENSDDGAIYSKENLEIKGSGSLEIESLMGHGIKASDNLRIEEGKLIINAESDGIHINDTFKMIGGEIDITAIGDGIDCESIVNISGGKINIETNGTPIEAEATQTEATEGNMRRPMWEDDADVEFEKSTKGINAEWMMSISGGEINVDSASHAIHCQDEMEISGGSFTLSSKYDKGISAHGNLTIGGETTIDVTKSTEGIESKNVMTINDGVIKVVSSDDALNATGGNSGMMPFGNGGNFGGNAQERAPFEGMNGAAPTDGTMQTRPNRGMGGQGSRRPEANAPANGENTPQTNGGNTAQAEGETVPQFNRDRAPQAGNGGNRPPFDGERVPPTGNGEGMPPFGNGGNRPQFDGEFVPPTGNGEGMPPFGNGENRPPFDGERVPPTGNGEGMPPFGNGENVPQPGNGGNAANRPQMNGGGMFGGMGRDMKECLIINGGYLEVCGNDDCIDTNGNLTINGGTIKAANPTGSFTGNFGVLDADGKINISESADIILAGSNGNANSPALSQNKIVVYCKNTHNADEKITVSDSKGKVIFEYAPSGSYKTVMIASAKIKTGENYKITIGDEAFDAEIANQSTIIGEQTSGGMGFGRGMR